MGDGKVWTVTLPVPNSAMLAMIVAEKGFGTCYFHRQLERWFIKTRMTRKMARWPLEGFQVFILSASWPLEECRGSRR